MTTFDLQPTLAGEHVIIRPVAEPDRATGRIIGSSRYFGLDTVVFWVGEHNMRSRRAMEKIGAKLRDGIFTRELSGADPYVVYEISKRAWSDRVET